MTLLVKGGPAARWADDIARIAGRIWMRLTRDRGEGRKNLDDYTQQWVKQAMMLFMSSHSTGNCMV